MVDWKNYTMVALTAIMLVSLGFNAVPEPNNYCEARQLKAYCTSLSSTSKTCYTLLGKTGGKQCDSGWKAIPIVTPTVPECPPCEEGLCPATPTCKTGTYPTTICPTKICPTPPACIQTCKGCGGGGGGGSCPTCPSSPTCPICPSSPACPDVNVVAYTDTSKWFCDGIGADANCVKDETLELPIT